MSSICDNQVVSLVAQDGEIENISIYSGRAEVARTFKALVKEGEGRVDIHALPVSLVEDSLRVEGHGWASIHGVAVDKDDSESASLLTLEAKVTSFKQRQKELESEISAEKQARSALGTYLGTVKTEHTDLSALRVIFDEHRRLSKEIDGRILVLEQERTEVDQNIKKTRNDMRVANAAMLSRKVSVGIRATREGELSLSIKYLVQGADWKPTYDIQAKTQTKDKNLSLSYKAHITQSTYEDWHGALITLETATPSLDVVPPVVYPWKIWVRPFDNGIHASSRAEPHAAYPAVVTMPSYYIPPQGGPDFSSVGSGSPRPARPVPPPKMRHLQVPASDKGGVMATFHVPGRLSLPSDMRQHTITIAQLELDADLSWYTIPLRDSKVYIKAKIKNSSDYRIIPGQAKTYVDGSFASTGTMPLVSPQETFDFLLGVDSGIKVAYLSPERKTTQSGLYNKTISHIVTQRISIHNTRSTPVKNLKVTDIVPVSEDQRIEVRLISPALTIPPASNGNTEKSGGQSILKLKAKLSVNDSVKVAPNVRAQWSGLGEPDVDQKALGKDGMVSWFVSLDAQERVTLVLQYEVSHLEGLAIEGM